MKIIQIMPEFGLGGAEIMCENLTYALRASGHTVIVVSLFDYHSAITERLEAAGVDIRYLGKKLGLDCTMIGKLFRVFREEKPDVIHTHRHVLQYAVPAAVLAGVRRRVHTVHSVAQKENGKLGRRLNKIFFRYFGVVPVALSDLVRDTIESEYKMKIDQIPVILNGIDLTKCREKESYEGHNPFRILHIGRFAEAKNHEGLIEAFRKFHDSHPDSVLQLIGDGEKRAPIMQQIEEQNLSDCIQLLGLQSDVYGYLHDADVFTLPSLYEGIPMTLIEAMGTGLPIVATAVGGIPDMLHDRCAILTDVTPEAVCKGFEAYYSDEALRKAHGRNAKAASGDFSSMMMAKKYTALYTQR